MNFYPKLITNRRNLCRTRGLVVMNMNEEKLRQISITITVLNRKEKLSKSEKELKTHLENEREQILKTIG